MLLVGFCNICLSCTWRATRTLLGSAMLDGVVSDMVVVVVDTEGEEVVAIDGRVATERNGEKGADGATYNVKVILNVYFRYPG